MDMPTHTIAAIAKNIETPPTDNRNMVPKNNTKENIKIISSGRK
jgi:hypothetical protein